MSILKIDIVIKDTSLNPHTYRGKFYQAFSNQVILTSWSRQLGKKKKKINLFGSLYEASITFSTQEKEKRGGEVEKKEEKKTFGARYMKQSCKYPPYNISYLNFTLY